jgi:hypothetical protein
MELQRHFHFLNNTVTHRLTKRLPEHSISEMLDVYNAFILFLWGASCLFTLFAFILVNTQQNLVLRDSEYILLGSCLLY